VVRRARNVPPLPPEIPILENEPVVVPTTPKKNWFRRHWVVSSCLLLVPIAYGATLINDAISAREAKQEAAMAQNANASVLSVTRRISEYENNHKGDPLVINTRRQQEVTEKLRAALSALPVVDVKVGARIPLQLSEGARVFKIASLTPRPTEKNICVGGDLLNPAAPENDARLAHGWGTCVFRPQYFSQPSQRGR